MRPAVVLIFHQPAAAGAGRLSTLLASARYDLAERHARAFSRLGADRVEIIAEPLPEPFGRRLRVALERFGPRGSFGAVILGSGAAAAAGIPGLRPFVDVARGAPGVAGAIANNRYSADLIAVGRAEVLRDLPDLATDNVLPRWLDERAGVAVADLRDRWRLQLDVDGPLDVLLLGGRAATRLPADLAGPVTERLVSIRRRLADQHAEFLVAGRTSSRALGWLERSTPCRVRAWVEERGLRASSPLDSGTIATDSLDPRGRRAPASILGRALEAEGPDALGTIVGSMADAAVIDTRVLLAARLGADKSGWPAAEDQFASDLLAAEEVHDPWLRALTRSARDARIPVLLGAHTLVGPGLRLVVGRERRRT